MAYESIPDWIDLEKDFHSFVERHWGGCWQWTGRKDSEGRGKLKKPRFREITAARLSWLVFCGPVTADFWVIHQQECRNLSCVNPDHLQLCPVPDYVRKGIERRREREATERAASPLPEHKTRVGFRLSFQEKARLETNAAAARLSQTDYFLLRCCQEGGEDS